MNIVDEQQMRFSVQSQEAEKFSELTADGYYIKAKDAYYRAGRYDLKWEFGLNKLQQVRYAPMSDEITSDEITMVFKGYRGLLEGAEFWAMNLDVGNHDYGIKLRYQVVAQDGNLFTLKFDALKPEHLLIVSDAAGFHVIGFGSVSDRLIEVFKHSDKVPYAVLGHLQDAIKSFPDNQDLKNLVAVWETRYTQYKLDQSWQKVAECWQQYNDADTASLKEAYAKDVEQEINYYLSLDENPVQKAKCESYLQTIAELRAENKAANDAAQDVIPDKSELVNKLWLYRAYENDMLISMAEIGDAGDVLIRFKGLGNEHEGLVYRHKREYQNEDLGSYIYKTMQINGENWNTFSEANDGWGSSELFVYPPDIDQRVNVYMSEDREDVSDSAEALFADYVARVQA